MLLKSIQIDSPLPERGDANGRTAYSDLVVILRYTGVTPIGAGEVAGLLVPGLWTLPHGSEGGSAWERRLKIEVSRQDKLAPPQTGFILPGQISPFGAHGVNVRILDAQES